MIKRCLLTACAALTLTACGSRIDSMQQTIEYAIYGPPDINLSAEEISEYQYPIQYLRIGEGPQIVLGLGFDHKGMYKWQSGQQEVLVTSNGRIVQTQGLANDLSYVSNLTNDPLACLTAGNTQCDLNWQWQATVGEGFNAKQQNYQSQLVKADKATVILGNDKSVTATHWVETVTGQGNNTQWQNHYWLEEQTHRVVKSQQSPHASWAQTEMHEILPYNEDLNKGATSHE